MQGNEEEGKEEMRQYGRSCVRATVAGMLCAAAATACADRGVASLLADRREALVELGEPICYRDGSGTDLAEKHTEKEACPEGWWIADMTSPDRRFLALPPNGMIGLRVSGSRLDRGTGPFFRVVFSAFSIVVDVEPPPLTIGPLL